MRRSATVAAGLLAGVVCLLAGSDRAAAEPPARDRVRQLLSGYESVPGPGTWKQLGPDTLEVLVQLYNDISEPPYVRLRAVRAAAHYPSPAARTFLLGVARTPHQKDLFVREAVLALAEAFDDGAIDAIAPFMESTERVVREAAARALGRIGNAEARGVLRHRLPAEDSNVVREAIREGMSKN